MLKLPNDFVVFFFTYDFAADFNTQLPWEKSEYLDHTMLGVSVTTSVQVDKAGLQNPEA